MTVKRRRARGLSSRLLSSGLLQVFGLDALLVAALAAMGVSVYRFSPDLVWGYGGIILLVGWWAIGKSSAPENGPKAS